MPLPIPLTYIVDINSTDPDTGMNFRNVTSETSLSVSFLEEFLTGEECMMIEFSVSAENVAGVGESATIIDTVPICELKINNVTVNWFKQVCILFCSP